MGSDRPGGRRRSSFLASAAGVALIVAAFLGFALVYAALGWLVLEH